MNKTVLDYLIDFNINDMNFQDVFNKSQTRKKEINGRIFHS